jgi:hypothetical protein
MTSGRLSGPHGSRRRACQCRAESLPTRAHPHHEGLAWRSGALALWICVFPGKNGLDARTTRLLRPQQHHSRADTITSIASRLTCRDDSAYAPLAEAGRDTQPHISEKRKQNVFSARTGAESALNRLAKFNFWRTRFLLARRACHSSRAPVGRISPARAPVVIPGCAERRRPGMTRKSASSPVGSSEVRHRDHDILQQLFLAGVSHLSPQ